MNVHKLLVYAKSSFLHHCFAPTCTFSKARCSAPLHADWKKIYNAVQQGRKNISPKWRWKDGSKLIYLIHYKRPNSKQMQTFRLKSLRWAPVLHSRALDRKYFPIIIMPGSPINTSISHSVFGTNWIFSRKSTENWLFHVIKSSCNFQFSQRSSTQTTDSIRTPQIREGLLRWKSERKKII